MNTDAGDRLLNGERLGDKPLETPADKEQDLKKVKYINKATFPNLSTPLIKAALNGHVSCVRVLILAGADKDLQNADKKTAMDVVLAQIENLKKNLKQKDGNESRKVQISTRNEPGGNQDGGQRGGDGI